MPAERSVTKREFEARSATRGIRSVCSCILIVAWIFCLSIVILRWQARKKVQGPPCKVCGLKLSRKFDMKRHMERHNENAEFVLFFSNSLILIDTGTYFLGSFHVLGQAASTVLCRGLTSLPIIGDSMHNLSSLLDVRRLIHLIC